MHSQTPTNPFRALLSQKDRAALDRIRTSAIDRFGFDAYRMEDTGGDNGSGGDSGGDNGGDTGDDQNGGSGDNGAGQGGSSKDADGDKGGDAQKVEDLPEWAQKIIKDTRDEAAKNRTGRTAAEEQQQKILKAVAQAAGLKVDGDDEPTVEGLAKDLTDERTDNRSTKVELAVYKAASKHKGDPDALLDSRGFLAKLADLDPKAEDFAGKVDAAIKDAVKDNPKLRMSQAGGSSSADHGTGGTGENGKREPKSLDQAVGGHYGTT